MINFLALLGWSPGDDREVLTRAELIELFALDRVNASNPVFDQTKLEWLNGEHIRRMDRNDLLKALAPILIESGLTTPLGIETRWSWMLQVVGALQERLHLLTDVVPQGSYFFTGDFEYDAKGVNKQFRNATATATLQQLADAFAAMSESELTKERAEETLRELAEANNEKPAKYIHPLRLALSGVTGGPGIFDIVALLGQNECLKRIRRAIAYIENLPPQEELS